MKASPATSPTGTNGQLALTAAEATPAPPSPTVLVRPTAARGKVNTLMAKLAASVQQDFLSAIMLSR